MSSQVERHCGNTLSSSNASQTRLLFIRQKKWQNVHSFIHSIYIYGHTYRYQAWQRSYINEEDQLVPSRNLRNQVKEVLDTISSSSPTMPSNFPSDIFISSSQQTFRISSVIPIPIDGHLQHKSYGFYEVMLRADYTPFTSTPKLNLRVTCKKC